MKIKETEKVFKRSKRPIKIRPSVKIQQIVAAWRTISRVDRYVPVFCLKIVMQEFGKRRRIYLRSVCRPA